MSHHEDMRLGLVVGRDESWAFVRDLHNDWQSRYRVDVFQERGTPSPFFKERLNRRRLRDDLARFLAEHDVVFFEWASELLALASRLPRRARIITRLHRYEMYQWADHIRWDAVEAIILVSHEKKREFVERFPDQAAKCVVIPAGIDLERFAFRPRPFAGVIGTLCHLTPRKRVYELILAMHQLRQKDEGWQLRVGGGHQPPFDDYYHAMTDLVRRLDLGSCVTFDGPVADAAGWLRSIDIFISNSYSEGLQVAPMEAMASGCFCLSHWWAGAEEMLPVENLYFTDSELVERLVAYAGLAEPARQHKMAELRGIAEERFDGARCASRVRDLIEGRPETA